MEADMSRKPRSTAKRTSTPKWYGMSKPHQLRRVVFDNGRPSPGKHISPDYDDITVMAMDAPEYLPAGSTKREDHESTLGPWAMGCETLVSRERGQS